MSDCAFPPCGAKAVVFIRFVPSLAPHLGEETIALCGAHYEMWEL